MKLRMSQTCSTCKHAQFGKGDMHWGGKKQGGFCKVFCDGEPPEIPRNLGVMPIEIKGKLTKGCAAAGQDWTFRNIEAAAEHDQIPSKETFLILVHAARKRWYEQGREQILKKICHQEEDYRDFSQLQRMHNTSEVYFQELQKRLEKWEQDQGDIDAYVEQAGRWYDAFVERHNWWKENWPKCRLIHRQTVCDLWKEGSKSRESFAKQIVARKHSLHES